jgi:hypothetical protein
MAFNVLPHGMDVNNRERAGLCVPGQIRLLPPAA